MVATKTRYAFEPDYAVAPGDTLHVLNDGTQNDPPENRSGVRPDNGIYQYRLDNRRWEK